MPGVSSSGVNVGSAASHSPKAWARRRRSKSSIIGPYSTSTAPSPCARYVTCGVSSCAGRVASTVGAGLRATRRCAVAAGAPGGDDALVRFVAIDGHEPHAVARRELTELPAIGRRSP